MNTSWILLFGLCFGFASGIHAEDKHTGGPEVVPGMRKSPSGYILHAGAGNPKESPDTVELREYSIEEFGSKWPKAAAPFSGNVEGKAWPGYNKDGRLEVAFPIKDADGSKRLALAYATNAASPHDVDGQVTFTDKFASMGSVRIARNSKTGTLEIFFVGKKNAGDRDEVYHLAFVDGKGWSKIEKLSVSGRSSNNKELGQLHIWQRPGGVGRLEVAVQAYGKEDGPKATQTLRLYQNDDYQYQGEVLHNSTKHSTTLKVQQPTAGGDATLSLSDGTVLRQTRSGTKGQFGP